MLPPNESAFWPFLREFLRVASLLVFGGLIYDQFEANKDLLFLFLAALASGSITTVADLLSRKNAKEEADKKP